MRSRVALDASLPRDAPAGLDASYDAAVERAGEIFARTICARFRECGCEPFALRDPSRCESDALRDFRVWWLGADFGGVRPLDDEAELTRVIEASVDCTGARPYFPHLVVANANEGEACDQSVELCGDGSVCDGVRCVRLGSTGGACARDYGEARAGMAPWCEIGLECIDGTCRRRLGLGERCLVDAVPTCDDALVCAHARCVRPPPLGEACDDVVGCASGFACEGERCVTTEPHPGPSACAPSEIARPARPTRFSEHGAPIECVPVGSSCERASDCGWASCVGTTEGLWRCQPPGPHVILPPEPEPTTLPACTADEACESYEGHCACARGTTCIDHVGVVGGRCVPDARDGESCDAVMCAEGLVCEQVFPPGSRCLGQLCAASSFFFE